MKATIKQSKGAFIAGAVALALVCATSVGTAMSYFTANVQAQGGHTLKLGSTTEIFEKVVSGKKEVQIQNTGDVPCFVRVKAYSDSSHPLTYSGQGWSKGEGDWYYADAILQPGEMTPVLSIEISGLEKNEDFNVVVVHESTIVSLPDGSGGDWSVIASSSKKEA